MDFDHLTSKIYFPKHNFPDSWTYCIVCELKQQKKRAYVYVEKIY